MRFLRGFVVVVVVVAEAAVVCCIEYVACVRLCVGEKRQQRATCDRRNGRASNNTHTHTQESVRERAAGRAQQNNTQSHNLCTQKNTSYRHTHNNRRNGPLEQRCQFSFSFLSSVASFFVAFSVFLNLLQLLYKMTYLFSLVLFLFCVKLPSWSEFSTEQIFQFLQYEKQKSFS